MNFKQKLNPYFYCLLLLFVWIFYKGLLLLVKMVINIVDFDFTNIFYLIIDNTDLIILVLLLLCLVRYSNNFERIFISLFAYYTIIFVSCLNSVILYITNIMYIGSGMIYIIVQIIFKFVIVVGLAIFLYSLFLIINKGNIVCAKIMSLFYAIILFIIGVLSLLFSSITKNFVNIFESFGILLSAIFTISISVYIKPFQII